MKDTKVSEDLRHYLRIYDALYVEQKTLSNFLKGFDLKSKDRYNPSTLGQPTIYVQTFYDKIFAQMIL
jgi:hypothetical protein